jgi:DNA polymerase-3 subunit gamma/tau
VSVQEQPQEQQRSLYRRHRPRTFAEVVGQEPVVRTLRNAVQREKVHHAYLFVGSRGTGKTSMAKILAACLNCERRPTHPTVEPCGECDSCLSIARANSLDVIEMDAASNNSVDDIRELRESVAYAPVSGRRKVYILDEAHMLSTAAWNAFLKTLEEPPPNTVFVLATTEASKVPATVVDRCHRFDFHRPSVEQIASVVQRTADAESIEIPPEAVAALARAATGSFRDALGTLEQLVTYSGRQIELADVLAVLGVADASLLAEALDAVAAGDARRALKALEQCVEQGRDAGSFASDLEVRSRELLVVQTLGEVPAEIALTPEADAALRAQAERIDHAVIVRVLELLGAALESVRAGADARTRLELALVKAARPDLDGSPRALLARIERLERRGLAPAVTSEHGLGAAGAVAVEAQAPTATPERTPEASVAPALASAVLSPPLASVLLPVGDVIASPAEEELDATASAAGDLESLCGLWPAVVELVRTENGLLGALIAEAQPVEIDGRELTVAFASSAQFLRKKAADPSHRAAVTEALLAVTGVRWRLSYELRDELGARARTEPSGPSEEDWVRRLMEAFDAEELPGEWDPTREGAAVQGAESGLEAASGNEQGS